MKGFLLLWHAFWLKAWAVSIRIKIMGIVAVGILASALALVLYEQHDDLAALRDQLQERGIAVGTGLATQSRDLVLTDNQFALYTLIKDVREADNDLIYIFVLNARGNVLVHTFDEGFPTDLLGKNEVPFGEPYRVQRLQAERGTIQDVAVPILGGKAGVVRLGMSEATINATVARHIRHILVWVAVVLVLGLTVANGLASILTKPISQLAQAARAVGKGDFFRWKTPAWAKDEIGALGAAFNDMSEELKRKEEMRAQLLAKVISAQEDERKRIARELHDETSQALTSLMVGLRLIEDSSGDPHIGEKVTELRALAARTLDEVHHLATALRPSLLDDLGLVAALQKYIGEYSVKMNINVDSHISLNGQHLPSDIETTVFRIVQESLTNITKYAQTKNVSIVVQYRGSSLVAIIEDDGNGFNVGEVMSSPNEKNLGLLGMYERASLSGGKLTIESQRGAGTTVFLEVPLKLSKEVLGG
ncbi:MAG: histidine kinase [Candidatus Marsarchaeota archaeon]|nr:histidine kinase [Candidatus Marsarchaeota archaeon]